MEASPDPAQTAKVGLHQADASTRPAEDPQPGSAGIGLSTALTVNPSECFAHAQGLHSKGFHANHALHCAGAKLQERASGQFNFDIARFAKIAEESKSQAVQEPETAAKASASKQQGLASAKRDWNAQVQRQSWSLVPMPVPAF